MTIDRPLELSAGRLRDLWQEVTAGPPEEPRPLEGRFVGRNSLAAFRNFEKWFATVDGVTVGCNRHPLAWLIGPGYFTVDGSRFDYRRVPPRAPEGWPPVVPNTGFFPRAVYGDLEDEVRWLTSDILVGAAFRGGRPLDSYFILVRR